MDKKDKLIEELKKIEGKNPNPYIGLKKIVLKNYEYEAIADFILSYCQRLLKETDMDKKVSNRLEREKTNERVA